MILFGALSEKIISVLISFTLRIKIFVKTNLIQLAFVLDSPVPYQTPNTPQLSKKNGEIYLYIKDTLNTRYPDKLWKKYILSRNFTKSLQELDLILNLWPKFFVCKIKHKLTKLYQILIRKKIIGMKKKSMEKIDIKKPFLNKLKESSLITKIKFENLIEKELLHRFNLGVYGDLYPYTYVRKWRVILIPNRYSTIFTPKKIMIKPSGIILNSS